MKTTKILKYNLHFFILKQCFYEMYSGCDFNLFNQMGFFVSVIPQQCRYRGVKYDCGLSISCVLGGGRPLDLCSGGMIWACCVDREVSQTPSTRPDVGVLNNASKF